MQLWNACWCWQHKLEEKTYTRDCLSTLDQCWWHSSITMPHSFGTNYQMTLTELHEHDWIWNCKKASDSTQSTLGTIFVLESTTTLLSATQIMARCLEILLPWPLKASSFYMQAWNNHQSPLIMASLRPSNLDKACLILTDELYKELNCNPSYDFEQLQTLFHIIALVGFA